MCQYLCVLCGKPINVAYIGHLKKRRCNSNLQLTVCKECSKYLADVKEKLLDINEQLLEGNTLG